jgi:NADPH2:quinone reductase
MKAWQVSQPGGLDCLEWIDLARPVPADNQCLVKVEAAALNFSDVLMIGGKYQIKPPLPFTPGQEISGTIINPGANSKYQVGQMIATKVVWGAFAEYSLAEDNMIIPLTDEVSLKYAVALPVVYTTAHIALFHRAKLRAGETVLVHAGAGGVGLAAIQLAKSFNATVIATVGNLAKSELLKQNGADLVLDYSTENWVEEVIAFTDGKGADVIVDPVGGEVAEKSLNCIAWEGRHLVIGFAAGTVPKFPGHKLLLKNASAVGVYWSHENDGPLVAECADELVTMLKDGKINPVIDTQFRLDQLPDALDALAGRRTSGKVVLSVSGDE